MTIREEQYYATPADVDLDRLDSVLTSLGYDFEIDADPDHPVFPEYAFQVVVDHDQRPLDFGAKVRELFGAEFRHEDEFDDHTGLLRPEVRAAVA
ncbi:hypothetical protein [Aeromicrobium sp.]|uniref:hypothetical protein n=1 Tax=Aeromicrobium sp. TaxID=1871063 RepID=UPI0039E22156